MTHEPHILHFSWNLMLMRTSPRTPVRDLRFHVIPSQHLGKYDGIFLLLAMHLALDRMAS